MQISCCLLLFTACKEEVVDYQTNDCKRMPAFVKSLGFDLTRTAFSTSEKKIIGVVLVQKDLAKGVNSTGEKIYQHPSWKSAGSMGPIQLDPQGNCFVGPVPVINVIDNPTAKQNIIYKVDAVSGEMKPFIELPITDAIPNNNPYGILGFAYLCESNTLYVSTVLGSDRQHENGVIYAVDITSGKVIDKIINTDAMGMGISFISGNRKLYFGSARTQNIFSIILSSEGKFKTKPQLEFSITDIGPRGDDKVRRIKFDKAGQMQLHAIEFNFNLTAPTEKQESIYNFTWDEEKKIWVFNK
jgi:hypothetical protein